MVEWWNGGDLGSRARGVEHGIPNVNELGSPLGPMLGCSDGAEMVLSLGVLPG